jgi:uncharacterized protein YndB with AHSA1/START domain
MTVSETGAQAEHESLTLEVGLPHAPEKVWRALTDPDLLAEWLLPVVGLQLEPGAEFTFKTQAYPGWDGTVSCRMIEIEECRKPSYTWTVPFLDTVVTFSLTGVPAGTRLIIMQSGFKAEHRREFGGARFGWKMMAGRLAELLARTQ